MPPKGRRLPAYAAASVGQPQLDVDELKSVLDAHQEEYQKQADANAEVEAAMAASGSGEPAEGTEAKAGTTEQVPATSAK